METRKPNQPAAEKMQLLNLKKCSEIEQGLKAEDHVRGSRQEAGFHVYFYEN
jgi:hypothetical protein